MDYRFGQNLFNMTNGVGDSEGSENDSDQLSKDTALLHHIRKKVSKGNGLSEEKRHKKIAETLKQGGNVNACDNHGNTLLHIAIQKEYTTIVRLLLAKGAKVNITNNNGKTSLDLGRNNLNLRQILTQSVNVPKDGNCLFWAVSLAYLTHAKDDVHLFDTKSRKLFGGANEKHFHEVKKAIESYNPCSDSAKLCFENESTVHKLVTVEFRKRLVEYMRSKEDEFKNFVELSNYDDFTAYLSDMSHSGMWGGEAEIRAMSEILNCTIEVYGTCTLQYSNGEEKITLYHVSSNTQNNNYNRNHYEFSVSSQIVDHYRRLCVTKETPLLANQNHHNTFSSLQHRVIGTNNPNSNQSVSVPTETVSNENKKSILPPFTKDLKVDKHLELSHANFKEFLTSDVTRSLTTIEQLQSAPVYPSLHTFALLASITYKDDLATLDNDSLKLLNGWQLLTTASNMSVGNRYFGAAYYHFEHEQIIIAHRGTLLNNPGSLWTDLKGVFLNEFASQMSSASAFVENLKNVIADINTTENRHIQIFLTGHSLGGWLAQITAFTWKYLKITGFHFQLNDKSGKDENIHTVAFDSPGCKGMLEKMRDNFDVRYDSYLTCLDSLDITSYLSAPNRINTCNLHVGSVYRIFLDFSDMKWHEKYTSTYNQATHNIDKFVKAFQIKNAKPKILKVVDWPISNGLSGGSEYNEFFDWSKHFNNYHPETETKEFQDTINKQQGFYPIRYQTKPYFDNTENVSVFSEAEHDFLLKYKWLRELPQFFKPQEIFSVISDEAAEKFVQQKLKEFALEDTVIKCKSADSLNNFIPFVKRLLRLFPDIVQKTTNAITSAQIMRKVYQLESMQFCTEIEMFPLDFDDDTVGMRLFLKSNKHKVIHITSFENPKMHVVKVCKIFNSVKQDTVYVKDENYTVMKLLRLLTVDQHLVSLTDFLNSISDSNHLLLLDCTEYSQLDHLDPIYTFLTKLLTFVQDNLCFKMILITQKDREVANYLNEICGKLITKNNLRTIFEFEFCTLWNNLTLGSQQKLLEKPVVTLQNSAEKVTLGQLLAVDDLTKLSTERLEIIEKLIDSSIVLRLNDNENISIGSEPLKLCHLEESCVKIYDDNINFDDYKTFLSGNIFFISGTTDNGMNSQFGWWEEQSTKHKGSIVFCNSFAENSLVIFRDICSAHTDKMIYWFHQNQSKICLQQVYNAKFYLARKFNYFKKIVLQKNLKHILVQEDMTDTFIFEGISNVEELLDLLAISKLYERHILTQNCNSESAKIKFSQLCTSTVQHNALDAENVHFLKVFTLPTSGEVTWLRSFGFLDTVRKFIDKDKSEIVTVDEKILFQMHKDMKTRIVIISDEPGMGKSTTLTSLSDFLRSEWVIRVDLKDCMNAITHLALHEFTISAVAEFFAMIDENGLGNNFAKQILQLALEGKTSKTLFLLFDGFDEIINFNARSKQESQRNEHIMMPHEKVIELIQFLNEETVANIWITTRDHSSRILEDKFSVFSITFEKVQHQEQIEYLQNFWMVRFTGKLNGGFKKANDTCSEYAEKLLEHTRHTLGNEMSTFMGVPLQLKMIAEVFPPDPDIFNEDVQLLDFVKLRTVLDMYDMFIKTKFDIYIKEKVGISTNQFDVCSHWIKTFLNKAHMKLAFQYLFPSVDESVKSWIIQNPEINDQMELNRVGLIRFTKWNEGFEFTHRTFAEYFAAGIIISKLRKMDSLSSKCRSFLKLLINEILNRPSFKVMRVFMNGFLGKSNILQNSVKCISKHVINMWLRESELFFDDSRQTVLHRFTEENHIHLLNSFLQCFSANPETLLNFLTARDCNGDTVLYLGAKMKNYAILTAILNFRELFTEAMKMKLILSTIYRKAEDEFDPVLVELLDNHFPSLVLPKASVKMCIHWNLITKFLTAAQMGDVNELQSILNSAGDANISHYLMLATTFEKKTALHLSAENGMLDAVNYLIRLGSNIDVKDRNSEGIDNFTPLHYAIKNGHLNVVKALIESHADINLGDRSGNTALHLAARFCKSDIVSLLIEKGADLSAVDKNGMTPFAWAAKGGYIDIFQLLLDSTENKQLYIDKSERNGITPIHHAAKSSKWDMVLYLIEQGADMNQPDKNYITPLSRVLNSGKGNIIQFMIENNAKVSYLSKEQSIELIKCVTKTDIQLDKDAESKIFKSLYKVISLSNCNLFQMLLDKRVTDYADNQEILDKIILLVRKVYEELTIKKLPLSFAMRCSVEEFILSCGFYTEKNEENILPVPTSLEDVLERAQMVCDHSNLIIKLYSGENCWEIDEEFIFTVRFLAQNIHVLKRQIKSTYNKLPWEEMEFYLVIFLRLQLCPTQFAEIFTLAMDKFKMLSYLRVFIDKLMVIKITLTHVDVDSKFPKQEKSSLSYREDIVHSVLSMWKTPSGESEFKDLYQDYYLIRNDYSLKRMQHYIQLAVSVDLNGNPDLGKLVIERALQVLGENLKNTVESPNMSDEMQRRLLNSAPYNLRQNASLLRDSLSHTYAFAKRLEFESDDRLFENLQNDLKKVDFSIHDMLYNKDLDTLKECMVKIRNSDCVDEIRKLYKTSSDIGTVELPSITVKELEEVKYLIGMLDNEIKDQTFYEKNLFQHIGQIFHLQGNNNAIEAINLLSKWSTRFQWEKLNISMAKSVSNLGFMHLQETTRPEVIQLVGQYLRQIVESVRNRRNATEFKKLEFFPTANKIFTILVKEVRHVNAINDFKAILEYKDTDSLQMIQDEADDILKKVTAEIKTIEDRKFFQTSLELQKKAYEAKLELVSLFSELKNIPFRGINIQRKYENLCTQIGFRKSQKTKIDSKFKDSNWEECTKIVSKKNLSYETLLKTLKTSPRSKNQVMSEAYKEFTKSVMGKSASPDEILGIISGLLGNNQEAIKENYIHRLNSISFLTPSFGIESNEVEIDMHDIAAMEMILLDLTEIADSSSLLADNRLLLDSYAGILQGKILRNYLAHGDPLFEVLLFDTNVSIILNARQFLHNENVWLTNGTTLVGERVMNNVTNLNKRFSQNVDIVVNQQNMFIGAYSGDIEKVKISVSKGADIKSIDRQTRTGLECSAASGNLEVFNFFLPNNFSYNNVRTVLSAAATYGHINIMNHVIEKYKDIFVNSIPEVIRNLLLVATEAGHADMIEYLINSEVSWPNKKQDLAIALCRAVSNGYITVVETILASGIEINSAICNNLSALHWAARLNHTEIVLSLLDYGFDVNTLTPDNEVALHFAAGKGNIEIIRILIEYGANIDARDIKGESPLLFSVVNGDKNVVELLLQNENNVNVVYKYGATALHIGAIYGHKEVVEHLLEMGALPNACGLNKLTPLCLAATNGHGGVVQSLFKYGADVSLPDMNGFTPLHYAAQCGQTDIIKLLIVQGASKSSRENFKSETPLHLAAENGHEDAVECLLDNGVDIQSVNSNLETALHLAISKQHVTITKTLLRRGANVNAVDSTLDTPLHVAATTGNTPIVKILIKYAANVNARTDENDTPLLYAVKHGHKEVVEILLQNAADVNVENSSFLTPLHMAAVHNKYDILPVLLKYGEKFYYENAVKDTPLHIAADLGYMNILIGLLKNGANVNAVNAGNETPLHYAVFQSQFDAADALLKYGADPNLPTNIKQTPLHLAALRGHKGINARLFAKGPTGFNVNASSIQEISPLFSSLTEGNMDAVEKFLKKGTNVLTPNGEGITSLHLTAENNIDILKVLIQHNARVV